MKKITFLLTLLLVASCATHDATKNHVPNAGITMQSSMVTVRHSNDKIPLSASYQWAPEEIQFYNDNRLAHAGINNLLKETILNGLNSKGYTFNPESKQPDFQVGYVAALKTALDDHTIEQTYGVRPGLVEGEIDQTKFEKGTIIVDLIEPVSGRLIWRGAGQSLATLEDIPPELRKQRVHQFIKNLFSALPGELQ